MAELLGALVEIELAYVGYWFSDVLDVGDRRISCRKREILPVSGDFSRFGEGDRGNAG